MGRYGKDGEWYAATVAQVLDGSCVLAWEDGDPSDVEKTEADIRFVRRAASAAAGTASAAPASSGALETQRRPAIGTCVDASSRDKNRLDGSRNCKEEDRGPDACSGLARSPSYRGPQSSRDSHLVGGADFAGRAAPESCDGDERGQVWNTSVGDTTTHHAAVPASIRLHDLEVTHLWGEGAVGVDPMRADGIDSAVMETGGLEASAPAGQEDESVSGAPWGLQATGHGAATAATEARHHASGAAENATREGVMGVFGGSSPRECRAVEAQSASEEGGVLVRVSWAQGRGEAEQSGKGAAAAAGEQQTSRQAADEQRRGELDAASSCGVSLLQLEAKLKPFLSETQLAALSQGHRRQEHVGQGEATPQPAGACPQPVTTPPTPTPAGFHENEGGEPGGLAAASEPVEAAGLESGMPACWEESRAEESREGGRIQGEDECGERARARADSARRGALPGGGGRAVDDGGDGEEGGTGAEGGVLPGDWLVVGDRGEAQGAEAGAACEACGNSEGTVERCDGCGACIHLECYLAPDQLIPQVFQVWVGISCEMTHVVFCSLFRIRRIAPVVSLRPSCRDVRVLSVTRDCARRSCSLASGAKRVTPASSARNVSVFSARKGAKAR